MADQSLEYFMEMPLTPLRVSMADKLLGFRDAASGKVFNEGNLRQMMAEMDIGGVPQSQIDAFGEKLTNLFEKLHFKESTNTAIEEVCTVVNLMVARKDIEEGLALKLRQYVRKWEGAMFSETQLEQVREQLINFSDDRDFSAEVEIAKEALKTGWPPKVPKLSTPERQLLWGATVLFLMYNPSVMNEWPKNRSSVNITKTSLWKQILKAHHVRFLRALFGSHIFNLLRSNELMIGWGAPGSWFAFYPDPQPGLINCDLLYSMLVGFDHARSCVIHEIAHAVQTKGFPKEVEEVRTQMNMAAARGKMAHYERFEQLLKLKEHFFNAAEDNCVNRFTEQIGSVFGQNYGYSLNYFYTAIGDVGRRYTEEGEAYLDDNPQARFNNLAYMLSRVFLANNGLFDNSPEGWRKVKAKPDWITGKKREEPETVLEGKEAFDQLMSMCKEVEHAFPPLQEIAGGPEHYSELADEASEKRFALINEIWELYAADLAEEILDIVEEEEEEDVDDALDKFQMNMNKEPDPPPPEKEEEKKEEEEDKPKNPNPPDTSDKNSENNESGEDVPKPQDEEEPEMHEDAPEAPDDAGGESGTDATSGGDDGGDDMETDAPNEESSEEGAQDQSEGEGSSEPEPQGEGSPDDNDDQAEGQPEEKQQQSGEGEESGEQQEMMADMGEDESESDSDSDEADAEEMNRPDLSEDAESEEPEMEHPEFNKDESREDEARMKEEEENQPDESESEEENDNDKGDTGEEEQSKELEFEEDEDEATAELVEPEQKQKEEQEPQDPNEDASDGEESGSGGDDTGNVLDRTYLPDQELASISDLREALKEAMEGGDEEDEEDGKKEPEKGEPEHQQQAPRFTVPKPLSLDQLAHGSWENFASRVSLHGPIIGLMAEALRKLKDAQLKLIHKISKRHSLTPEGGDLRRYDPVATQRLLERISKQEKFDKDDLNLFKKDKVIPAGTRPTRIILIDGSRSMSMGNVPLPIDKAMQEAVIDYMASKLAGYDTYISMFGPKNPLIIAQPGDNPVEIGKRIEIVHGGLNTMTFLSPSLMQIVKLVAYRKKFEEPFVGFTNFVVYTDGDIDDLPHTRAIIQEIFTHAPKCTFDFVLVTNKQGTPMDILIRTIDTHNPLHQIGVVRGDSTRKYPMSLSSTYKLTNRMRQAAVTGKADPSFLRTGQFRRLLNHLVIPDILRGPD